MSKFSRPDRSHFFPYRRGETYPTHMTMNFRKLNVGFDQKKSLAKNKRRILKNARALCCSLNSNILVYHASFLCSLHFFLRLSYCDCISYIVTVKGGCMSQISPSLPHQHAARLFRGRISSCDGKVLKYYSVQYCGVYFFLKQKLQAFWSHFGSRWIGDYSKFLQTRKNDYMLTLIRYCDKIILFMLS